MNRLQRAYLLMVELGPGQLLDYAQYQAQLRSGAIQRLTPLNFSAEMPCLPDFSAIELFAPQVEENPSAQKQIIADADRICAGFYTPFGGAESPLNFTFTTAPLLHWTQYGDTFENQDVKTIWEPARFCWVYPLCQAYLLTRDEKYARCFWQYFDTFLTANPVNAGPNWASGQEVALRLIPWLAAVQTFQSSPEFTPARQERMALAIWQAGMRIPPTLAYARSQHNNHYLSEALGVMLAGYVFQKSAQGKTWLKKGFAAFEEGILSQVERDGTYSQHSNNYHRLMLHLALVFTRLCDLTDLPPSTAVRQKFDLATRWLMAQYDAPSGRVPNLGHNDGSNLLPIGGTGYNDYRPTLQAAGLAFLGGSFLPAGQWDALTQWLKINDRQPPLEPADIENPSIHRVGSTDTWGSLRSVRFHSRPAHADQLHVDLWWKGDNIALDTGTYAYNLPLPWQNALARTGVHNTVCVAEQDQMIWAGKFLWLQRAQAEMFPPKPNEQTAILYCNLPVAYTQVRSLKFLGNTGFEVTDTLELVKPTREATEMTLQWLLPDWDWLWQENQLQLQKGSRRVILTFDATELTTQQKLLTDSVSLIRAGETLLGAKTNPVCGWVSPTYLQKNPALSLAITYKTRQTIMIHSLWNLSEIE